MSQTEEKILDAIDKTSQEDNNEIRLSSGVVLKGKKANPITLIEVMSSFPRPKPPVWQHPTMGREMENPDDPDYKDRVKAWELEMASATLMAFILLGTDLVSVPEGFSTPESDGWIEDYQLLNLDTRPNNARWRYLKWVTFKAVVDEKDLELIRDLVGRLSGVSEKSVESAEEFPGSK